MTRYASYALLPLMLTALLTGCSYQLRGPSMGVKIAVMDFVQAEEDTPEGPREVTAERHVESWWLGSRDVWHNPNFGGQTADQASLELAKVPNIASLSRLQVKRYFIGKQSLLENSTGELTHNQALKYFYETPPKGFARELNVDYLLRGRIHEAYYSRSRAIDLPWSRVELELELIDGATGKIVWNSRKRLKKWSWSPTATAERLLDDMIAQMDQKYWSKQ
ncbi:hypothetical protein JXA32_07150 [Candidatus Sumerlaeota bacterium]|nr:hypothetical protein [Candidatus Sumerlaeota bacterium]